MLYFAFANTLSHEELGEIQPMAILPSCASQASRLNQSLANQGRLLCFEKISNCRIQCIALILHQVLQIKEGMNHLLKVEVFSPESASL